MLFPYKKSHPTAKNDSLNSRKRGGQTDQILCFGLLLVRFCRPDGAWMMVIPLTTRGSATLHPWLSAAVPSGDFVIAQNASVKSILLE